METGEALTRDSEVTASYTLPVFPDGHVGEVEGVLPIIQNGSPN